MDVMDGGTGGGGTYSDARYTRERERDEHGNEIGKTPYGRRHRKRNDGYGVIGEGYYGDGSGDGDFDGGDDGGAERDGYGGVYEQARSPLHGGGYEGGRGEGYDSDD